MKSSHWLLQRALANWSETQVAKFKIVDLQTSFLNFCPRIYEFQTEDDRAILTERNFVTPHPFFGTSMVVVFRFLLELEHLGSCANPLTNTVPLKFSCTLNTIVILSCPHSTSGFPEQTKPVLVKKVQKSHHYLLRYSNPLHSPTSPLGYGVANADPRNNPIKAHEMSISSVEAKKIEPSFQSQFPIVIEMKFFDSTEKNTFTLRKKIKSDTNFYFH